MSTPAGARRTQAERRTETRTKLVEATIQTIIEKGYARTTVKEICSRAGVSHGGLFGRFDSLFGLVLTAAAEVGRLQIEHFSTGLSQLTDPNDLAAILALLRENARRPIDRVWTELMVAARTDAELRDRLAPVLVENRRAIAATSAQLPVLQGVSPEIARVALKFVLSYFDGDALVAVPYPNPDLDQLFIEGLTTLVQGFLDTARRPDQLSGEVTEGTSNDAAGHDRGSGSKA